MIDQFFGKTFRLGMIGLIALLSLGAIGYYVGFQSLLLFMVGAAVLVLSVTKLERGLFAALLELGSSAHGHLLSTDLLGFNLSLRMTIFIAVMLGTCIVMLRSRRERPVLDLRFKMFLPLVGAIGIGFLMGVLISGPAAAFSDGNAYFYLAYLIPILMVHWNNEKQGKLLQIFSAMAIWNMALTLIIVYIFSHFGESVLQTTYYFVRDLRIAEVTNIGSGLYRVFMQTQFFVVTFFFLLLAMFIQQQRFQKEVIALMGISLGVVIMSLSRSFWVGLIVALMVFAVLAFRSFKPSVKRITKSSLILTCSAALGLAAIAGVALIPIPPQSTTGADLADALSSRATEADDVAVSSRWNLLDPMLQTLSERPIEGSGFGKAVTFTSDDPRVRELSSDGTWSTVSMEWGWLEIWIKMGILAPVAFAIIFWFMIKRLLSYLWTDQAWLGLGFISTLLFLAATHFFSPYLNHPIGLGMILFTLPFIPVPKKAEAAASASKKDFVKDRGFAVAAIETD